MCYYGTDPLCQQFSGKALRFIRKLAYFAFSFSAAVFIARYLLPDSALVLCAVFAAALFFTGFFLRGFMRLRVFIVSLSLAAGFLWVFAYGTVIGASTARLDGLTQSVTAVVTSYPVKTPRGFSADINIKLDGVPDVGARFYYNGAPELVPGNVIEITARFTSAGTIEDSGVADALTAKGRFLTANNQGDVIITGSEGLLRYLPVKLSHAVAEKTRELFAPDTAPFMRAILTGNRDLLNEDTQTSSDLSVSGISHVVAVSGMHVSFIMGFLAVFVKRKRFYAALAVPVLLVFMAMTGFTPSVTRAGIMQLFVIASAASRREGDGITSLSCALFILLAVNPYSVTSAGLQLSFAAALGIILFTEKLNDAFVSHVRETGVFKRRFLGAAVLFVSSSLFTTLGALAITTPLSALHFGTISIVAPLTNLLTLWAVSVAFCGGIVTCALGFLFTPLGQAAAFIVNVIVRYVLLCARVLSSVPNASVYVSNPLVTIWLSYLYAMLIALFIVKEKARTALYAVSLAVVSLCAVLLITVRAAPRDETLLTVLDVGQGQSIVLSSGGKTAMIDCGGESGSNAGEIAVKYLAANGYTSLDMLILTHFHADHANGVEYLLSRVEVAALCIPDPEDSYLADDIISLARRRGSDILYITETMTAQLGAVELTLFPPLGSGDENERCVAILASGGGLSALITGDMDAAGERRLMRYADLPDIDLLVAGHHGSRYSTSVELLDKVKPELAAVSVGRNNYGHPAESVLERLAEYGAAVHRTDLSGTLTFSYTGSAAK